MIVTRGPRRLPRITHGAEPASTAFRSCFTTNAPAPAAPRKLPEWLQKFKKNDIIKAIQAVGLDPKDFDLENGAVEVRIKHRWSASCFTIGGDLTRFVGRDVVGDVWDMPFEAYSWPTVMRRMSGWLDYVKKPSRHCCQKPPGAPSFSFRRLKPIQSPLELAHLIVERDVRHDAPPSACRLLVDF
jgi:hypothetical protein